MSHPQAIVQRDYVHTQADELVVLVDYSADAIDLTVDINGNTDT